MALLVLAVPLNVAAQGWRQTNKPPHTRQAHRAKSAMPNSLVHDYKVDKHLSERSARSLDAQETADMIVTLSTPGERPPAGFRRYACGTRLDIINGYALCNVPVQKLSTLAQLTSVHRVHHNRDAHETDLLSSVAVKADLLAQTYGYSGAGVTVAFIDSDAAPTGHPDLADTNVRKFVDFVSRKTQTRNDPNGHGTHVMGIVAGNGASDPRFAGIAPGVKVVSLKVLDESGKGTIADIIASMDWVAKNYEAYNIRIVNMSVGAGVYESYWTDPLTLAAKALVDKGITVVAAAGNFGKNRNGALQWGGASPRRVWRRGFSRRARSARWESREPVTTRSPVSARPGQRLSTSPRSRTFALQASALSRSRRTGASWNARACWRLRRGCLAQIQPIRTRPTSVSAGRARLRRS